MKFIKNLFKKDERASFLQDIVKKAKADVKTIVLPESDDKRIFEAAEFLTKNKIANIVLLGEVGKINKLANQFGVSLSSVTIHSIDTHKEKYAKRLVQKRKHKGVDKDKAMKLLENNMYYACMMAEMGDVDGIVAGAKYTSKMSFIPALKLLKKKSDTFVSTYFIMAMKERLLLFADPALNINPTSKELGKIAINTAKAAKLLGIEPKIGMLSFSTHGSAHHDMVKKVQKATTYVKRHSDFAVDGEIQVDTALVPHVAKRKSPKSKIQGDANILVFPDLNSGNISYKLVERLAGASAFGPVSYGFKVPMNDLSRGCSSEDIIDLVAITCVEAQRMK